MKKIIFAIILTVLGCAGYACQGKDSLISPEDYIISTFRHSDVVLLAEDHAVKENLEFVRELIPILYENGIYMLGMEFGAVEEQERLDSLLSAPEYDENAARKMMFRYNTRWAIKEYMDLYREAWELNRNIPEGAKKFRILNLSYVFRWDLFADPGCDGSSTVRTPENMKRVFPYGNTEDFRCSVIEKEVLWEKGKILVLTGTPHAFTKFRAGIYDYSSPGFIRFEQRYMGNQLYDKYGSRIFSICLHQPFPNRFNSRPAIVSPAGGQVERTAKENGRVSFGTDLTGSPLGQLVDSSMYSMGYPKLTMDMIFDGYIFLKPIKELSSCTIDRQFLDVNGWEDALRFNPDPDWHSVKTVEEYWNTIETFLDIPGRYSAVPENL